MAPVLPAHLGALRRDVGRFHERLERVAAAGEELTPAHPAIDEAFQHARSLSDRAVQIEATAGWESLASKDADLAGTVTMGINAARTAAQVLGTAPERHAEVTASTTDARSANSADTWRAATKGRDLPNVRIVGSIPPPAARLVADRLANLPERVVRQLDAQGIRNTLFSGVLTDVHGYRRFRDIHPPGWSAGRTFADVPGVADKGGFAANPNRERKGSGHATDSLVLHELGHVVDSALARPQDWNASSSDSWLRGPQREVVRRGAVGEYFTQNPTEWYAESMMRYMRTPQSHAALARWYPETFAFLSATLGAPRFGH